MKTLQWIFDGAVALFALASAFIIAGIALSVNLAIIMPVLAFSLLAFAVAAIVGVAAIVVNGVIFLARVVTFFISNDDCRLEDVNREIEKFNKSKETTCKSNKKLSSPSGSL